MVCTMLIGVCKNAHAMQCADTPSCEQTLSLADSSPQCPCCPLEQQSRESACDFSCDCACHVSLSLHPFSFNYTPVFSELQSFDPFAFLPQVFLSKFIPPQLNA